MFFSKKLEAKQALERRRNQLNEAILEADVEGVLSALNSGPLNLNGKRFRVESQLVSV